ncbi:MAG: LCP family protein [Clostridium sp.]|nr:LCP family protein [Clostridium sp.]MDU7084322.1 LCP family protein [Clostridium sp.]
MSKKEINSEKRNKSNTSQTRKTTTKKRRRKKKKSPALTIGISLLGLALLVVTVVGTIFIKSLNDLNVVELDKSNLGIADKEELSKYDQYDKIKNILLLGTDQPTDSSEPIRSDTMMLLTIDPIHNKIKVSSFMRDSRVYIDGYGEDKLTHAYAYGGAQMTIKTFNENFGLNIEEFASVDFTTLPKIIDILGGVEIDITAEELNDVNNVIFDDNRANDKSNPYIQEPGLQTLSGNQALAYARNRSSEGGDYARTQRQRTVMEALFKKGLSTSVTSYPSLLSKILPYITTNMTSGDILNMGKNILSIGTKNLEQARFPTDEYSWGEIDPVDELWYLYLDIPSTKQQIQDYIFDDKSPESY